MRVDVLGARGDPLGQRFRQQGLHDELALSRDATRDPAATSRSFCPAAGTKYRSLKKERKKGALSFSFGGSRSVCACYIYDVCICTKTMPKIDRLTSPTRPECLSNKPPL